MVQAAPATGCVCVTLSVCCQGPGLTPPEDSDAGSVKGSTAASEKGSSRTRHNGSNLWPAGCSGEVRDTQTQAQRGGCGLLVPLLCAVCALATRAVVAVSIAALLVPTVCTRFRSCILDL